MLLNTIYRCFYIHCTDPFKYIIQMLFKLLADFPVMIEERRKREFIL